MLPQICELKINILAQGSSIMFHNNTIIMISVIGKTFNPSSVCINGSRLDVGIFTMQVQACCHSPEDEFGKSRLAFTTSTSQLSTMSQKVSP